MKDADTTISPASTAEVVAPTKPASVKASFTIDCTKAKRSVTGVETTESIPHQKEDLE